MGIKQFFRSVGQVVKRSSHRFKKLILRRARTIPNQFTAALHSQFSNVPLPPPELNPKLVTKNQRTEEYKRITTSVLPTFGPRVATPPPYVPESATSQRPSLDNIPGTRANGSLGPDQSKHHPTPSSASSLLNPKGKEPGMFGNPSASAQANGATHQAAQRNLASDVHSSVSVEASQNDGKDTKADIGFLEEAFKQWST